MDGNAPDVDHASGGSGSHSSPASSTGAGGLVNAEAVARMLSCDPSTVFRLARAGTLPSYKFGSSVRFDPHEVLSALQHTRGETMDPVQKRNKQSRDRAMELAEQTWVAELPSGATIILGHPGQSTEVLTDLERLRNEFGIRDTSIIKKLSESREAPTPWSLDNEIAAARRVLEELLAAKAARDAADAQMISDAAATVDRLTAEAANGHQAEHKEKLPPAAADSAPAKG